MAPFALVHHALPTFREVHYWYLIPQEVQSATLLKSYERLISPVEHANILQIKDKELQKNALLARVLARTSIARYIHGETNPQSLSFKKNRFGKPELAWPSRINVEERREPPRLSFNLSHTSSLITCGITTSFSIGIDIEEKGRCLRGSIAKFARRYFSLQEIAWLEGFIDPEDQHQNFLKLWTLKEAYVKAIGRGISGCSLKDFTILLKNRSFMDDSLCWKNSNNDLVQSISLDTLQNSNEQPTDWHFILFQPTSSHYASICLGQDKSGIPDIMKTEDGCSNVDMKVWKTIPLVEDELLCWKQRVLACSNSVNL